MSLSHVGLEGCATVELWLIYLAYVYNALFTQSQVAA